MKRALFNFVRWSHLRELSNLFISKALIILSLAPLLAKLIFFMDSVGLDPFLVKFAFCGACTYSLAYLLTMILIPESIRNFPNAQAFQFRIDEIRGPIDQISFFKDLPELFKVYGHMCARIDYDRLNAVLPPSAAMTRLGINKATFLLSGTLYELLDIKQPIIRYFIAIILSTGLLMMLWSIVRSASAILF